MSIYCLFGSRVGFIIWVFRQTQGTQNEQLYLLIFKTFHFCVFGHFRFAHNRSIDLYIMLGQIFFTMHFSSFYESSSEGFWMALNTIGIIFVAKRKLHRMKGWKGRTDWIWKILHLTGCISLKYSLKLALFSYDNHRVFTTFEIFKISMYSKVWFKHS